jgi:hypothetical protein
MSLKKSYNLLGKKKKGVSKWRNHPQLMENKDPIVEKATLVWTARSPAAQSKLLFHLICGLFFLSQT